MAKRLMVLLISVFLFSLLLGMAQGEEITYTGTVKGGSLHMRSEPSASSKVVDTYKAGAQVTVLENDGVWCRVQAGKKSGYMMTQYLEIKADYPHLGWGRTENNGAVVNVRSGPGFTYPVLYKAMGGCVFELVEDQGAWYRVRAGSQLGYLEKKGVTVYEGDYALDYSLKDQTDVITADSLYSAVRETGSRKTITRSEGEFTYTLSYPELGVPTADSAISSWVQTTLRAFEQDHLQNHSGEKASCAMEYQALLLDGRYQSVLLLAEYRVGEMKTEAAFALNADSESGAVLNNEDFFSQNSLLAMYCLEGAATRLMASPADGYDGKPDASWLKYAVLGRDGVQIFLPAGLYLPQALGTRRLTLRYHQVAECMTVDAPTVKSAVRVIDPTKPMVALTFDDGPSEETDRILSALLEYGGRATFCVIGNKVDTYGDVIKRALAGGNEIACHTWNHTKLTTISASSIRSQIEKTTKAVRELTGGYEIKVLRPPYGSINKNVRTVCKDLGLVIAMWQIDTLDWSTRNTNKTYNAIMKGVKSGHIVLCHDLYSSTASAMERVIPDLIAKGYQLVTVSELLSFHKDGPQPGTVYSRVDPENMIGQ